MSDIFTKIDELLADVVKRVNNARELLKTCNESNEAEPKTEVKKVELEDVRKVLTDKSRAGFTSEVKELLKKHGANKLSEINPDEYEALIVEAGNINGN